jgi:hypothetical protein
MVIAIGKPKFNMVNVSIELNLVKLDELQFNTNWLNWNQFELNSNWFQFNSFHNFVDLNSTKLWKFNYEKAHVNLFFRPM